MLIFISHAHHIQYKSNQSSLKTTQYSNTFGDKTSAKELAIKAKVPIIKVNHGQLEFDILFACVDEPKGILKFLK